MKPSIIQEANIINILGIADLPLQRRIAIMEEAIAAVEWRILAAAMKAMDEKKRNEVLERFSMGTAGADLAELFAAAVPNFERIVEDELKKFKLESALFADGLSAAIEREAFES